MVLTWVFAVCLLNAQGQCHAYIPQTNFAYLPLVEAKQACDNLLRGLGPDAPGATSKNVCIRAYQYDVSYGQGNYR